MGFHVHWWQALALGAVQGLTEFLPVSSSGHLVLAEHVLGVPPPGLAFEVGLHCGTLAAVAASYRSDVRALLLALAAWVCGSGAPRRGIRVRRRDPRCPPWVGLAGRLPRHRLPQVRAGGVEPPGAEATAGDRGAGAGLLLRLAVASLPAALLGWAARRAVEALFASLPAVAAAWSACGLLLVAAQRHRGGRRRAEELRLSQALLIGAFQALALAPGFSRSGATISAGLLCGLEPGQAARFGFLLSLPAVGGALLAQLPELGHWPAATWTVTGLAAAMAAATGLAAIRWCVAHARGAGTAGFGYYCLALGGLALARSAVTGEWR